VKTNNQNIPDEILIKNCITDNRKYQELLYRKYADKMYNVCLTYEKDEEAAADILQEGFIKVFRNITEFKFKGSLEGWIRKIIVNTALEHYRKKTKERDNQNELFTITDYNIDDILSSIHASEIIKMVNELPEKASVVLKLFAIEGYTHADISKALEITIGTSKSQLNRARCLIKQKISKLNG